MHKYVSDFLFSIKIFVITDSKGFVLHFYNHNKNLYNKFEFLKSYVFILFKIVRNLINIS